MATILFAIGIILAMILGAFLGVMIFIDKRCVGGIIIKDENDQLLEIQFKPGTDLSITDYEYIVLQNRRVVGGPDIRELNRSYNGQ